MSATFEEEMQELEDNMASVTIQDSDIQDFSECIQDFSECIQDVPEFIQNSENIVTSVITDLLNDIERLEPPSKAEVAASRYRLSQNPEINALLAQIEADMTVVSIANKYESEMAFAECADRVERFVESIKIPTFIQAPPPGLFRSNSVYDVSEPVLPELPMPPKMVRSVSQAASDFCPPTPRKAF